MLTKDAERVQKETLQKILEENGSNEYLKGLNGRTDHERFKDFVLLVTHKDLEPYIQRMVDGDTSPILTGKPITTISLNYFPGTTQGKPKFVPFNNDLMESTMQIFKVGEEYEIILTTFAGLYRYRLGDVVKVVGFHNSTPELQFICRSNLLLTINIDKNTEKDLQLSVEAAGKLFSNEKLEVVDFTSHVDLSTDPGHYVICWEVSGEAGDDLLRECCNCLDRSFVDASYVG
ncbi:Jasmonoyl--L-amino acid synthetase JAR4 [Camellia lanceoleosa]|uniref:Jasmonoyl--L-amino acid synthetase JAR4 n=1 Tax=Camellia lanceoleosa TaxID=1840588 RepID=A0ACC0IFZ0_9ERIC|nr:Jasmonoyl--L-amino acid synthetase JAR4 [Camellia lanceoleosa]